MQRYFFWGLLLVCCVGAPPAAQAPKGIPAESIESVEVITTPPARYDGEGTAGIINIVLKKGVKQSANGRLGAGTGNRNSSVDASLNFR